MCIAICITHMSPDLPKRSYIHTVSRCTFDHHLIATSMDQQHNMGVTLQKVEQSDFTQASFLSMSDVQIWN